MVLFKSCRRLRQTLIALMGALLAACSTIDMKPAVKAEVEAVRKGPAALPVRTITGFSPALRCMDNLFITWGIRDLPVIVEDLNDQTKKVNAGTKDMLISAVSDMTRRSKAIKLITYGKDTGNFISLIESVQGRNAFKQIPPYGIRGSVSQLDDNLARKNGDIGLAWDPYLSLGAARNASASVLGIDLTMVSGRDLSVVSGVTSRNSVVIYKEGQGADADASIRKFGINFSMTLSRSDGQSQALRNLVELAVVELFGKLGMLPYWRCLGSTANDDDISAEIDDWFHALAATPAELITFFQYQLRLRGYYQGPTNGERSEEFDRAVAGYRRALGLTASNAMDIDLFRAYLEADHHAVSVKIPPPPAPAAVPVVPPAAAVKEPVPPAPPPAPISKEVSSMPPIRVMVGNNPEARALRRGQPFQVSVVTNRDAHVYCYFRDEHKKVQRIFPNRFDGESLIRATHPITLPGKMRFQLMASPRGITEAIVCYATERDVLAELPRSVSGRDFENLPVATLEDVKQAIRRVVDDKFSEGVFHVRVN